MPADPVGLALVAVVREGVLGLREKVIGGLGLISSCTAGVAKGQVLGKRRLARGRGGRNIVDFGAGSR